jgi:hypothetical protein
MTKVPRAVRQLDVLEHYGERTVNRRLLGALQEPILCEADSIGKLRVFDDAAPALGGAMVSTVEVLPIFLYGQTAQPISFASSVVRNVASQTSLFSPASPSQTGTWYFLRKST